MSIGASLTALDARLGTGSGAIVPSGWTPPEGTAALVLGDDTPGIFRRVAVGEFIEAMQAWDIGAGTLLRLRAHLRPPASGMPSGVAWALVVRRNGVDRVTHVLSSRELDRFDIAFPIFGLYGRLRYGFRLVLIGSAGLYDVELPGVYVDALIFDADPTSPAIINRVPEPNETNVPIDTSIYFEGVDVTSTTLGAVTLRKLYVNGVLAYDYPTGDQNGYTTTGASLVQFGAGIEASFTTIPPVPFPGQTLITVRAIVAPQDGAPVVFDVPFPGFGDLNAPSHPFLGGEAVQFVSTGTLPAPLQANTTYWIVVDDSDDLIVLDAPQVGNQIGPFTTTGTGTHSIIRMLPGMPLTDITWSFTTADVTPPRVASAMPIGARAVRVAFSENVVEVSGASANDAINPSNWTISLLSKSLDDGLPAVPLAVTGVTVYDTATVDITTDVEMTPGAIYLVTVANVDDLAGNTVVPPYDEAIFSGYADPAVAGRSFDLLTMLPAMNVVEDASGDLRRFIACLQEPTNLMLGAIDRWTTILDPDFADERYVDVMLVEAGNPFDLNLTLNDKRRLLRVLVPIYKSKGTDAGIINAIRFFVGLEVTITVPWFIGIWDLGESTLGVDTSLGTSDKKTRYTFVINSPISLTDEQRERITAIATYMKAAHTHFLISEPTAPPALPNHWELGLSSLGENTSLH